MDTRHEDKAKFGKVHRSAAKKGAEKPGRRGEERTMISAMEGTSASAAAAAPLSERYAACPPSRANLLDPDAVKLVPPRCVHAGIHYPRPLFARLARSFFRAIFFGPRGNICGSCEAVDRSWDSVPRTRQVLTFRGSPSPANYACLFLPLPLLSPLLRLPPLRYRSLSALRRPASSRGFSLTFSRYRPPARSRFYPLLRPFPPLSPGFDLLHSGCPRANFLHSFERFSTLYFSFSIIELRK